MAIIWERVFRGIRYEVRAAGNTRRLYTDGVFHTQFNPSQPLCGNVWTLLLLPVFAFPPNRIRRVLVLGIGGGAVIRQLQRLVKPDAIFGVELDPVHLRIAARFFGVKGSDVSLHCADAVEWLRAYRGAPFDMIVDDLFGGEAGEPMRTVRADAHWLDCLVTNMSRRGVLVMNFPTPNELKRSFARAGDYARCRIKTAVQLTTPRYENAVGAFFRSTIDSGRLRTTIDTSPAVSSASRARRLVYRVRRL